jgi:alcohol oxidase
MTLAPYTAYPYSRGHVHITGPEVSDRLDFDIGFFNDPNDLDLKKQVWAYKKGREIMRRTAMYRGEIAAFHPKFPDDSRAACIESAPAEQIPQGEAELADLEYSAEDDGAIEQYIRENIGTTWHSLGTARMAPREELGVVDEKLSVYGVQGLKVVDLSIVPKNIGGNTNNTALAVGEKASDIIAQELGLSSRHP